MSEKEDRIITSTFLISVHLQMMLNAGLQQWPRYKRAMDRYSVDCFMSGEPKGIYKSYIEAIMKVKALYAEGVRNWEKFDAVLKEFKEWKDTYL